MADVFLRPIFKELADSLIKPEIRLPKRDNDCPAAPICEALGNLREGCTAGSAFSAFQANPEKCMAGLMLLISRLAGMWPQEMIEEVEAGRKPIGFSGPPSNDRAEE